MADGLIANGEFIVDMTSIKNQDLPEDRQGRLESHLKSDDFFSGTWSSSFFLGSFLGPTVAGFTVEHFGFRATTFGFVIVYALVLLMDLFELMITIWQRRK